MKTQTSYISKSSIKSYHSVSYITNGINSDNNYTEEYELIDKAKTVNISVFDAAAYILSRIKECTTMKLHKLLYYCQAWSLVWDEMPLFKENIEGWANGPMIRELLCFNRGYFTISYNELSIGNEYFLSAIQKETIDKVLDSYADKPAQWLIDLTRSEEPWNKARKGLISNERGSNIITLDSMAEYYSSL